MAMTFTGVETVQPSRGYLAHPAVPDVVVHGTSSDWKANGPMALSPRLSLRRRAGNRHVGGLEDGVVRRGEPTIR
jgi:hypothetical protein